MKQPYVPPQARLICFRPMERLATEDSFEDTMALFGADNTVYAAATSGTIDVGDGED